MDGCNFDRPRNVIPRWRTFAATVELGELGTPPRKGRRENEAPRELTRRLRNWRPSDAPVYAADLLSSSLVAGQHEEVREAARELLKNEDPKALFQHLAARRVLSGRPPLRGSGTHAPASQGNRDIIRSQIVFERKLLRYAPDNPIAWTELAHAYTAVGEGDKAERCLQAACQLAPHNRFVLRSATRFWIHDKDPERSLWLLRRSSRIRSDPWLLAAELATSTVCSRVSKEAKRAERLLGSEKESTIHFSELAAALGVIEFEHGHTRRARNLFLRALQRPTENAVAQAVWFNRQAGNTKLENLIQEHLAAPRGYEALAWIRFRQGVWDQAVQALEDWLDDEPFASRPAIDASYLATLAMEDHSRAESIAMRGLQANPKDHRLENNLAVAQLHMNRVEEAARIIARLRAAADDPRGTATMHATRGLLAFRQGHPERGAQFYLEAADEAAGNQLKDVETQALFIGAIEAIGSGIPMEHPLVRRASGRADGDPSDSPALELLRERVRRALVPGATKPRDEAKLGER